MSAPHAADARALGERIEALVGELPAIRDREARERCAELARLLMEFYGAGLARVVAIARELPQDGETLVRRLADDPLVASQLLLHGLHPQGTEARVVQAVEDVRRRPAFRGRAVELGGVRDGVAHVRLAAGGCAGTADALREEVVRSVLEAAPELARVEVEDAPPLIRLERRKAP